jgi:hypothetical protein
MRNRRWSKRNERGFGRRVLAGVAWALLLAAAVLVYRFFWERDRKIYEYMRVQQEIQANSK